MSLLDKFISDERAKIIEELEERIWERLEPRIEEALFSRHMTIEKAAQHLDVSPQTVRRMIGDRELPAFKVRGQWRIRFMDLEEWITRQLPAER